MKIRYVLPASAAVALLALTGCTNDDGAAETSGPDTAAIQPDDAAVALLPDAVKESGKLVLGTDAAYPPNEFKDADGNPTGWSVELTEAVAAKLGLEPEWEIAKFDSIIPRIDGGKMDVGSSSFTDNAERQKSVDFVNYYEAGVQWVSQAGTDVDPDDACGLSVAVQAGTFEDTDEVPAKSAACEDAGKEPIDIQKFDAQEEATNAVVLGKVDAMSADSPVALNAIAQLDGELQAAGDTFDVAPYGYALKKDGELTEAVQAALQSLMDDGTYLEILEGAGVEAGAIDEATINAGGE